MENNFQHTNTTLDINTYDLQRSCTLKNTDMCCLTNYTYAFWGKCKKNPHNQVWECCIHSSPSPHNDNLIFQPIETKKTPLYLNYVSFKQVGAIYNEIYLSLIDIYHDDIIVSFCERNNKEIYNNSFYYLFISSTTLD